MTDHPTGLPYLDGITWEHTSAEAHARIDSNDVQWENRSVVVRTFFRVPPGSLPDMKAYADARWVFRPNRFEARWTDTLLGRIEISGFRVLKSGQLSDRYRQSYQAMEKEIARAREFYSDDVDHGIVVGVQFPVIPKKVFDVIAAHVTAHPLPRLLIR